MHLREQFIDYQFIYLLFAAALYYLSVLCIKKCQNVKCCLS